MDKLHHVSTSAVWMYFIMNKNEARVAVCIFCLAKISRDGLFPKNIFYYDWLITCEQHPEQLNDPKSHYKTLFLVSVSG